MNEKSYLLGKLAPEDDIKTHMSNERTFFKWVWSALRLGSIGTFVLAFFDSKRDPYRLPLVAGCWVFISTHRYECTPSLSTSLWLTLFHGASLAILVFLLIVRGMYCCLVCIPCPCFLSSSLALALCSTACISSGCDDRPSSAGVSTERNGRIPLASSQLLSPLHS